MGHEKKCPFWKANIFTAGVCRCTKPEAITILDKLLIAIDEMEDGIHLCNSVEDVKEIIECMKADLKGGVK